MRSLNRMLLAAILLALVQRRGFADEKTEAVKKRFGNIDEWYVHIVVEITGAGNKLDSEGDQQSFAVNRRAEVAFKLKGPDYGGADMEAMMEGAIKMAPEKEKPGMRKSLEEFRGKKEWFAPPREKGKPEEVAQVFLSVDDQMFSSGREACGDPFPYTDTFTVSGHDSRPEKIGGHLKIDYVKGTYDLWLDSKLDTLALTTARIKTGGIPEEREPNKPPKVEPGAATGFTSLIRYGLPLPDDATVLGGCERIPRKDLPFVGVGYGSVTGTITWSLSPVPLEDVELVLDPDDYENWRPRPGEDEKTEGNGLTVIATLKLKGGGMPSRAKMRNLTLRLEGVSHEPGVCLNWPRTGAANDNDLQFLPDWNVGEGIKVDGNNAGLRKKGDGFLDLSAWISAFDGGAWGILTAEAVLEDGRLIRGILPGKPGNFDVLLPKRSPDSKIADVWKKKHNASDRQDDADDEKEPAGDGQPGDGLTLYEEYRGFRVDGEWFDDLCEPDTKELFIHNNIGPRADPGLDLFESATQLKLHDTLRKDEFRDDRVINFNHDRGPHLVDQHGLFLMEGFDPSRPKMSFCRESAGTDFPGPPKNTKEIVINTMHFRLNTPWRFDRGGEVYAVSNLDAIVAHELGHAIGLRHHGEQDTERTWVWKKSNEGEDLIYEDGTRVIVFDEKTGGLLSPMDIWQDGVIGKSMTIWLGERGGQHSGDEACIMRYTCANAYRSLADLANSRYYHTDQVIGKRLCTSPAGTGKNMPGNQPQSRYGGASKGRGNCRHMFVISDKWEKKSK